MASILLNIDNTTPSPTMRDFLPQIKMSLGIAPNDSTKDAQLCYLFGVALAKYSDLAPLIKRQTISTVNGRLAYPLAPDCVYVCDVANPSQYGYYNDFLFLPMIDTPASTLFGYSDYAFRAPSERIIREGILQEIDHYAMSFNGYYVDGTPKQLYLLPVAVADGLQVIVRYAADYLDQNPNPDTDPLNPTLTTLPAGHAKYLVRLMKWAVNDQRADLVTSSMMSSVQGGGSSQLSDAWKMSNRADRILAEVGNALGANVGLVLRS